MKKAKMRTIDVVDDNATSRLLDGPLGALLFTRTDDYQVDTPVGDDEEVIGELDDLEAQVWALVCQYRRLMMTMEIELTTPRKRLAPGYREQLTTEHLNISDLHKGLRRLFWYLVRDRLEVGGGLGVRVGNAVVLTGDERPPQMPEELKRLLGVD